jgi:hypothetical protein
MSEQRISSFKAFYPFYLAEHSDPVCRNLHYVGSTLVLAVLAYIIATSQYSYLWSVLLIGYGFAWVGHFFFEHNRPATFKYPFYSLASDWVMFAQFITRRLPTEYFKSKEELAKQKVS